MKVLFGLLALCLVAVHAGTVPQQPPLNYERMVDDVLNEMAQIAKEAAVALQQSIEDIVLDPMNRVEVAVESIEVRREESDACVSAESENIETIVDGMQKELAACGAAAAKTSADIMTDISAATQQLVYGGYDVVTTYRRCQRYTNSVLQSTCYIRLTAKATLYLANARKSIKTIRESTNERIPAVVTDTEACTTSAADNAINELNHIQESIDACIARA